MVKPGSGECRYADERSCQGDSIGSVTRENSEWAREGEGEEKMCGVGAHGTQYAHAP